MISELQELIIKRDEYQSFVNLIDNAIVIISLKARLCSHFEITDKSIKSELKEYFEEILEEVEKQIKKKVENEL